MTDPVPHPGARPAPFEFPFAEAATARTALVELHDELTTIATLHSDAHGAISGLNQGATIELFHLGHSARMEALGMGGVLVMGAIGALDDLVTGAQAAEQARNEAIAVWISRDRAYDDAVAAGQPVANPTSTRHRNIPV